MLTKRKAERKTTSRPLIISTAGATVGDSVLIDLIQGEAANKPLRLVVWDGKRMRLTPCFRCGGVTYVPAKLDPTIACAVRLPARAIEYGSTRDLFTEISELVSRTTRLRDRDVVPIVFFVFATWLAECLPLAPFLWVISPPTASSGPLIELLGLLCRRALLVTEPTLAGLRSFPMHLRPTIMTEISKPTRSLIKVFRASNRQGAYVAAGEKMLKLFCPKVVFANQPLADPAIAGYPLEIALAPTREHIPLMNSAEAERVAAEFQSKLLMYRLVNYRKIGAPHFDLEGLTAPTRELAHSLASCIVGDDDLQSEVVPLLNSRDREIRADRASLLTSIVLEALLTACHQAKLDTLPMVDLTQRVNSILLGRGEVLQVSPETVGWELRALGFRTELIPGGRKGLALLDETRKGIHTLAAAHGVRTLLQGPPNDLCPHCAALAPHWKEGKREF